MGKGSILLNCIKAFLDSSDDAHKEYKQLKDKSYKTVSKALENGSKAQKTAARIILQERGSK